MSTARLTKRFHCSNDCRQAGCPGHVATLEHHHTSDTVRILVDGESRGTFDLNEWQTFRHLESEYRSR